MDDTAGLLSKQRYHPPNKSKHAISSFRDSEEYASLFVSKTEREIGSEAARLPVKWGVTHVASTHLNSAIMMAGPGDTKVVGTGLHIGHCAFSSRDVGEALEGGLYAGLGRSCTYHLG